jgi:hypothetical protein
MVSLDPRRPGAKVACPVRAIFSSSSTCYWGLQLTTACFAILNRFSDHCREHRRTVEFDLNVDKFPDNDCPFHLEFLLDSEDLFGKCFHERFGYDILVECICRLERRLESSDLGRVRGFRHQFLSESSLGQMYIEGAELLR